MKSHICGVQGECNDYCGGGQLNNLRAQVAARDQEIKTLREEWDGKGEGNHANDWCRRHGYDGCPYCARESAAKDILLAEQAAEIKNLKGE